MAVSLENVQLWGPVPHHAPHPQLHCQPKVSAFRVTKWPIGLESEPSRHRPLTPLTKGHMLCCE
jgi:hypothetical protein